MKRVAIIEIEYIGDKFQITIYGRKLAEIRYKGKNIDKLLKKAKESIFGK